MGGGGRRNPQLIISLTSYPKRASILPYTLYYLFTQNIAPDRICLYLSLQEYPNKESDLPDGILAFTHKGLEIRYVKENLKPYNKLIYALQDFPNDIIVTADDDTFYSPHWLERLYAAYTRNPQLIHAHRVVRMGFDEHNRPLQYNQWKYSDLCTSPSFLNFFTGVGGVLYPPHSLDKRVLDSNIFMKLCPTTDDIWFWAMAVLNDVKCNLVENNISNPSGLGNVGDPLWHINRRGQNDIQLDNVMRHFPEIREKLLLAWSES